VVVVDTPAHCLLLLDVSGKTITPALALEASGSAATRNIK
jgi:hypothetical protein